jgi:2-desacetyl-2-hydroxyethyl bacteriochlorophyllide A dehydrogenase
MKAVRILEPHRAEVADLPDPTPAPDEVVVEVGAVGICGTDLHILAGGYAPSLPIVPGHEFAGEVVAVGSTVADVRVGERVAADPNIACGACRYCRIGRSNLCERAEAVGVTRDGAMARYVAVAEANCVVLPEGVPDAHAALIEPISCAVHAFDVLRAALASDYLLYGAGPMGLIMVQLARAAGATAIDVVEPNAGRHEAAIDVGATSVATSADELPGVGGRAVVIDCSGVPAAIEDGLTRVSPGGTFVFFGVAADDAEVRLRPHHILMNEISVVASKAVLHSYERAAALLFGGVVDASALISHAYPLEQFDDAVAQFRSGAGRKIQVKPNE